MSNQRKSKTQRKSTAKPKASSKGTGQVSVIDEWGNEWDQCMPVSEETLSRAETQMGITVPKELRTLFLKCNGGRPAKSFFTDKRIEVGIGSLLPVRPPSSYKGGSVEATYDRLRKSGFPSSILPFAYDKGNAGIFCLDVKTEEILYWVHDEPEAPIKKVAKSLKDFLSNLRVPPY